MAHCYACDMIVEEGYDKKTDRNYCFECFEATNKVLLSQLDAEMDALFGKSERPFLEINDWISDQGGEDIFQDREDDEEES